MKSKTDARANQKENPIAILILDLLIDSLSDPLLTHIALSRMSNILKNLANYQGRRMLKHI